MSGAEAGGGAIWKIEPSEGSGENKDRVCEGEMGVLLKVDFIARLCLFCEG